MVIEIQPLHYGHSDGHTDICYSSDGTKLISCGGDGDVRIWNGFDDDDPVQTCLGEFVLCVRHKNEHILVGTDNNNVQLLEFPSGNRDGILTRFMGHVNHIVVGKNHSWVALASEDLTVKLIELSTKQTKTFSDLNGPPLSVSLCSDVKFLAVSCGDGKLRIYNIEDQSVVKEMDVVPKVNSFINAKLLCRTDFDQKHNKYFAYPDKDKIVVLNIGDWTEANVFSTDDVTEAFSITSFSHCGNYIAGVTLKGDIVVWNVRSQSLVGHKKHPKEIAITSIDWNPEDNGDLAFSDSEGYIGLAVKCTNADINSAPDAEFNCGVEDDDNVDFGEVQIEDDDDDNENAVSLNKLKNDVNKPFDSERDGDFKFSSRSPSPVSRPRTPEVPLQQAFMPSSTPDHLDPRYMAWNEVGVIRCYGSNLDGDDNGTRSIEVEFHDSSLHSSMMMANFQGYTMGSISTAALAVANNNVINVVPLGSSTKEWHLNLPDDQEIVCIATSQNLVCFGLESNLVHVCSIFGTQKGVVSVPGPIVCMAACSHVLMVAYHAASPRKDDQCIDIMLIKLQGISVENHYIKSALTPGSNLQWMGFSDMGTPAMMDSAGMVYLYPLQSNLWLPFCDTTKERSGPMDGFFLVAIYESFGTVRGIRCRGTVYPGFTPRPTVTELDIQSPFVESNTEKSQLEANLFTWSTLQIENTDKKYKEAALKTFALAAKNNLEQRAVEFAEMLGNRQIINLAMKYAVKLNKKRLLEKLTDIFSKLESESDDNGTDFADITISTPTNVIKPNKKLLLSSTNKILAKKMGLTPLTQSTPIQSTNGSDQDSFSTPSCSKAMSGIDTQSLSILEDEPKNPFLKNLKRPKTSAYNPLSLTDKFAGVEVEKEKENKAKNEGPEKRKKPDTSPVQKGKEKQRKLDRFMFSKRT